MIDLARLKELERAATNGPWHRIPANKAETPFVLAYGEGDSIASFEPCGPWASGKQAVADLDLTVALRNAAPALIAQAERVEALEAEIHSLQDRVTESEERANERGNEITRLKARLERANRVIEFAAYAIGAAERYAKITLSTNADTDAFADHYRALGRDVHEYIKRKAAYDRSAQP
jgi:hypothetical protein